MKLQNPAVGVVLGDGHYYGEQFCLYSFMYLMKAFW